MLLDARRAGKCRSKNMRNTEDKQSPKRQAERREKNILGREINQKRNNLRRKRYPRTRGCRKATERETVTTTEDHRNNKGVNNKQTRRPLTNFDQRSPSPRIEPSPMRCGTGSHLQHGRLSTKLDGFDARHKDHAVSASL